MDISIKMHTVMKGEKGCLTKEEIVNNLQDSAREFCTEDSYMGENFTKFIDRVGDEFAGRIPKIYNYDFNRLVAGLMGATCYMPENFEKLNSKPVENILNIATQVENSGHHSTFGHSFLTLEISGLPKALAMVLNNEKEYNTSEKSARYTVMKDIEPKQNALYEKWVNIFEREIKKLYPDGSNKFFDEKGKKARKLAQENARYLISVFTPTNMEYSTSFRQLNYICHWMEGEIEKPENKFYEQLIPSMQEFVEFCKDRNIYSERLFDGKDRGFSLFDEPVLKTVYSSNYQGMYKMSFACLAQDQRHRTLDLAINKFTFPNDFKKITEFYIPPIIANNPALRDEYLKDMASVAQFLPQGTLLDVSEAGSYKNFILKAKERLCACAQKEIRDLTLKQTKDYANELYIDANTLPEEDLRRQARRMANKLQVMTKGSRCKSGYKCKAPCGFLDGINLESQI